MCRFNLLYKWRLWIRPVVMTVYGLVIIVVLPILVSNAIKSDFNKHDQGALIGGVFVMMALPISFWGITQHMVHYTKPYLQKHIIRVLWMVPIYAVNAWLGLVFPDQSIYMDSLRECYEAYVIYNFMMYLLNYLHWETNMDQVLDDRPTIQHFFPFCCFGEWEVSSNRDLIHMCKHGILQYTVVRPLTTFISFVCELQGVYMEGEFRADAAFTYMIAVNNFSQFVAMYCLVLFYQANCDRLRPMKPIPKFLCIKAVVFFSFFQGVMIAVLVYAGVIGSAYVASDDPSDTVKNLSSRAQDFLICIEMFLAAVAHHYSFGYRPYVDVMGTQSCCEAFHAMWDVSDVHRDLKEHLGVVGGSLSRHIRGRGVYRTVSGSVSESSRLLVPVDIPASAPARLGDGFLGEYDSTKEEDEPHMIDFASEPALN